MRIGLVGKKLDYSYSEFIHNLIIEYCHFDYKYEKIELTENQLIEFLRKKEFDFVNVTIPYKRFVIPYIDVIDEKALEISAVNTIINKNGKLYGYNTDYYGFNYLLEKNRIDIKNKKCLILGTGATSNTVYSVLNEKKALLINKSSRKIDTTNYIPYDKIYENDYDVIINTTPVGTYPNFYDKIIELNNFNKQVTAIDVIYNPNRTLFLQEIGSIYNGLDMLIYQAIKSVELYMNILISDDLINKIKTEILKKTINIVLIGLPGSGKTTISKKLAELLNINCLDIDEIIETKTNMKINDIFEKYGEEYFRKKECEIIKEVSLEKNVIISTGGGVIKNYENIVNLKANGLIIWIKRDIDKIIIDKKRPLTKSILELQNLLMERNVFYKKYSDYVINNNSSIDDTIKGIICIYVNYINE